MGVRVTVNDTTLRDGEQSARVGIRSRSHRGGHGGAPWPLPRRWGVSR